jgi:pantoate--beta-alanine ligase
VALAIERRRDRLRATVAGWKRAGVVVGVVPTMGALHEGHLSLVRRAKAEAHRVVVTLFVNPGQFNNAGDLAAYPRTEAADAAALAPIGVDLLYVPGEDEMYPPGFDTVVRVGGVEVGLEDAFRPGHFEGVATVVAKLLLQTAADRAFFGEKDFQQLMLVRRLVRDLDIPCAIVGCPTVREADGLALSSRNLRLSPSVRAVAPALAAALRDAAAAIGAGAPVGDTLEGARARILAAGFGDVEYLELRREPDLAPAAGGERPVRLLAAAWLGGVRLIDNVGLPAT